MKKIAFIPGAFRPFGSHHMKMVEHYSKMCDEVIIIVSNPQCEESSRLTNVGKSISPEDAAQIISLCLSDSDIRNVKCEISRYDNPIRTALYDISKLKDCEIILGVSTKDDDLKRYDWIEKDYFKNNNVSIISPEKTAFSSIDSNGIEISASDIRNHIDDCEMLKSYLPVQIEDETFKKIYDILNSKKCEKNNTDDEYIYNSQIFEQLIDDEKISHQKLFFEGFNKKRPDSSLHYKDKFGFKSYYIMDNENKYHISITRDFNDRFRLYDSDGKELFRCECTDNTVEMIENGEKFADSLKFVISESADVDGIDKNDIVIDLDEEETEYSEIQMDDETLNNTKCSIIAYNTHILEDNDDVVYNPKTNPEKAVDILFEFDSGNKVEIYLDTNSCEWDSRVNDSNKLTPDQMGQFFNTDLSKNISSKILQMWPEEDPFFKDLIQAVKQKKINCEPCGVMTEDGEFRKGNIDINKSRQKNAAGRQERTRSGRKIVSFSDFGVKHTDEEGYYCWPEKDKEFKWSQWADWKKNHVLCRIRFKHNSYLYGCSLSMFEEDNENRGFRSYNLDLEPKLQYCTPMETQEMMNLSIVRRFLKNCLKRLNRFMSMSDEEIYEKINKPEKCTIDDIRKTKHVVKNTMKAIRERRADTYIYT